MEKAAQIIRKLTLAPILAGMMLVILRIWKPEVFQNGSQFFYTVFFLAVFPVLAYPLQRHIPGFRDKGREGQRNLAIIFAFLGYLCECLINIAVHVSDGLLLIGWTYLLSGVILLFLNQVLVKASGHAAGATAAGILPVLLGLKQFALVSILFLVLVYSSSLRLRRHTLLQLLGGTVIPVLCAVAVYVLI